MMNQYYGNPYRFSGRSHREADRGDRYPYRRPMGRGSMPAYPFGGQSASRGGCGCGKEQNRPHSMDLVHDRGSVNPVLESISVMQSGERVCDGNGGISPARKKLMEQIRAVDFALYEVILYLDVYPNSCDALETYHKLKTQKEVLHKEYEAAYGPMTAFGNQSGASWDWIDPPFPWEFGAD